jgi:hypothetical protein
MRSSNFQSGSKFGSDGQTGKSLVNLFFNGGGLAKVREAERGIGYVERSQMWL